MCEIKTKPKSRALLPINMADVGCCEQWIRTLSDILEAGPGAIDVVFLGGGAKPHPSVILSLRNALLMVPEHIQIRTVAGSSLSPLFCAVWLLGDERWIAQEARIWIPQLPEAILRGPEAGRDDESPRAKLTRLSEEEEGDSGEDGEDLESILRQAEQKGKSSYEQHRPGVKETECGCGGCRIVTELRSVAAVLNEWFPSWEYSGQGISAQELVELRVIRPGWIYTLPSSGRGRARHVPQMEPRTELPAIAQESTPLTA